MIHKEFTKVPKGFKRLEGATTAPRDKVWITNGKSLFSGERVSGLIDKEKWLNHNIDNAIERMKNGSPAERKETEKEYDSLTQQRRNLSQTKFNLRHSTGHLKDF